MLAVVAPPQHTLLTVQLVRHRRTVDFHARREHHQLEPLGHLEQREASKKSWIDRPNIPLASPRFKSFILLQIRLWTKTAHKSMILIGRYA